MGTIKFLVALGKIKQIIDKYFYRSCKVLSKRLWHRCLAVNFAKFLRTPFLQNTFSGCFSFHLRFSFGMLNLDNNKTEQSARPVKIFVDYLLYFSQSYQKFYRNCFYWNLHLSNIIYWLRKAMIHEKLSHLMLLSVHKTKTNELSLTETTSQFCQGNRGRSFTFPRFTDNDLPKLSPV